MEKFPLPDKILQEEKFIIALAGAYRLHDAVINTSQFCIITLTPDGIISDFNKEAENLLGYSSSEITGKKTLTLFHDGDEVVKRAKELSKELGQTIKPGNEVFLAKPRATKLPERKEWTYIRKDGENLPVLVSITALWDNNDNVIGYTCIAKDITTLKEADAKVKQSETHLHALITALDDIVLEVNKHGKYLNLWSKSDEQILSRENYIDKNIYEVLGDELADQYDAIIQRVLATRKTEILEYKISSGDNERWNNAKFSFISSDRVLICIRDITEKKQSEIEVIKSEGKFRTLAENIPGVIYLCNNDDIYSMIYLNGKIEELTGYTDKQFLSGEINFTKLFHPDDAPEIFGKVDKALAERKRFQLSYRLQHKSGEWKFVEETGLGVYHNNKLLYIEGFISDITGKKLAEEEFTKIAEENYRLFNNAVHLSVVAGFDGYFKRVNPTWSTLMGWSNEEMLSKPFVEFVHPDDVDSTNEASAHIMLGNNLPTFENRYRCKDGSYKWILWGSASDTKRELVYASGVDITERKKNEEQLIISKQNLEIAAENLIVQNRLLDEFAHVISHNLRSPIKNIQALIGLLNSYSSVEDYQLVFDKLKNLSKNLGDTMNELMDTIKVKADTEIKQVDIRFKELLDKVVQSLEGEMIQSGATITYNFNAAPKVTFSKTYLESIFQNLLTNAIKYRSPDRKPQIHIETLINNGRIEMRVSDNGLGIDLKRFGDKLFGLHKTFHDHKEAKGVGLFLTKTQIQALGGTITVESSVDKGSTFIITF